MVGFVCVCYFFVVAVLLVVITGFHLACCVHGIGRCCVVLVGQNPLLFVCVCVLCVCLLHFACVVFTTIWLLIVFDWLCLLFVVCLALLPFV